MAKYDIFISYRRDASSETAKHLFDRLTLDGYTVSYDADTLLNGNFNTELLTRISGCKDFILLCDAHVFDKSINENVPKDSDWLRIELAEALSLNKNVIPIMLDGFVRFPENLPQDISQVRYKNGPKFDRYYYDAFYQRLKHFFTEAPTDDITIQSKTRDLETSLLLEHGWLCYNQAKYGQAMEYFLQAADKGSANAINAIAIVHYEGKWYERNLQKAAQWFRYAAEMGYASAQRNLADCLRKGEGVPVNEIEAFSWYMRAAEKENIKSQYSVGECFENGWGVESDLSEAIKWYSIAANQGYEPAINKLIEIKDD